MDNRLVPPIFCETTDLKAPQVEIDYNQFQPGEF